MPALWRALRGRTPEDTAMWRLLAWATVAGIAIPFVLVTEPYNDTLQFYQVGLYLSWIFVAVTLARISARNAALGAAAIVLATVSVLVRK